MQRALRLRYLFFLICFLCSLFLFSQNGNYYIQNYSPKNYRSGANNFGATQNNEGFIFIANDNGVLIFDGINWQNCNRPDEETITCIDKTQNGEIVVGTKDGDIAIIEKDKKGVFLYRSLLKNTNDDQKPIEPIRQIITNGSSTYFLSADKLVEYTGSSLRFYSPEETFHNRAFIIGEHLYVADVHRGLYFLENHKLNKTPNTEELSTLKFFFCYKIQNNKYALGSRDEGIYFAFPNSADPTKIQFKKANSACDTELIDAEVNNGCLLKNGNFVISTNLKGAFLIDSNLNVLNRFNVQYGIGDDNIKDCYEDINGNIWLSLFYGVSYIEINSRVKKYERNDGIGGAVQSAALFNKTLYIATDKGVQYFDSLSQKFLSLQDFNKQTWCLFPFKNKLFICTAKGLYCYSNNLITQISDIPSKFMTNDASNENLLYCATDVGFDTYISTGNNIQSANSHLLNHEVRSIASTKNGYTAFSTENNGIYILSGAHFDKLDSISKGEGLPNPDIENFVFTVNNKILIGTDSGMYFVNQKNRKFFCSKDQGLWSITKGAQIFRATEALDGIVCSIKLYEKKTDKVVEKIIYLKYSNGLYTVNPFVTHRLKDVGPNAIVYDDLRKTSFVSCNEGLYFIDSKTTRLNKQYHLFIKSLLAKNDTLAVNLSSLNNPSIVYSIPFAQNDLKCVIGFSSFENTGSEFTFKLEGKDRDFSIWDKESKAQFSNLSEGNYTLHIRARSEMSSEIYELKVNIKILPPWYRSIWAYLIYTILVITAIYSIVRLNIKRLIDKNKNLEIIISERTSTIVHQKSELENKQKEIIDSIHYAQRIQQALLASDKLLSENLDDYFILFKPKDIVSGDFYWATPTSDGFLYMTADCTGHGVPGAFMSLLNISKLNETVNQKQILKPDLILNEVRNEIVLALNPSGSKEESKDGMDAVLCKLDRKNLKLQYSAAYNSFYIIRDKTIIVCKADKMPVGKGHDNTPFSFNELTLQKGDLIYTFTDGFADQFGGPKGKKLKYKHMEEIILSISHLPMNQQKQILDTKFEAWRGSLEQVDDVCIMGVRV